jgi:hypothetical protein
MYEIKNETNFFPKGKYTKGREENPYIFLEKLTGEPYKIHRVKPSLSEQIENFVVRNLTPKILKELERNGAEITPEVEGWVKDMIKQGYRRICCEIEKDPTLLQKLLFQKN